MDPEKLKRIADALQWEARYQSLEKGDPQARYFLADIQEVDADLDAAFTAHGVAPGKLLDIGTGLGTQAILLARRGFRVVATDASASALKAARAQQEMAGTDVRFVEDNILLSTLEERFDVAMDRGCFTILPRPFKKDYVSQIDRLLVPGGYLFLKVDEKLGEGLIHELFEPTFKVHSITNTTFVNNDGKTLDALFCVLQKL
jgi:cyclopropane fatty-acyl-phospholipid synthase-like methyltransferase